MIHVNYCRNIISEKNLRKEFKLRGYEFGKNYGFLSKISTDASYAKINSERSLFKYLSAVFCIPRISSIKRSVHVLVGIDLLRINPKSILEEENDSGQIINFNFFTDAIITDHLLVKGLNFLLKRKVNPENECIQQIQSFKPYKEISSVRFNKNKRFFKFLIEICNFKNFHKPEEKIHSNLKNPYTLEKLKKYWNEYNEKFDEIIKSTMNIFNENYLLERCNILVVGRNNLFELKVIKNIGKIKYTIVNFNNDKRISNSEIDLILIDTIKINYNFPEYFMDIIKKIKFARTVWLILLNRKHSKSVEKNLKIHYPKINSDQKSIYNNISENGFRILVEKTILNKLSLMLFRKSSEKYEKKIKVINFSLTNFKCWFEDLKCALKKYQDISNNGKIWLIANNYFKMGIVGFFNCFKKEVAAEKFRLFFHNKYNIENNKFDNILKDILYDDLMINVTIDDRNGLMEYTPFKEELVKSNSFNLYPVNLIGKSTKFEWITWSTKMNKYYNIDVYYSRINYFDKKEIFSKIDDETMKFRVGSEFSGKDKNGNRLMGLISNACSSTIDNSVSKYIWSVPNNMTLEQACTIPFTYCIIYKALLDSNISLTETSIVIINTRYLDFQIAFFNVLSAIGCKTYIIGKDFENKSDNYLHVDNLFANLKIGKSTDLICFDGYLKVYQFRDFIAHDATIIEIDGMGNL